MNRCHNEYRARGLEAKRSENTRQEQLARRPVRLPVMLIELADDLADIHSPEDLSQLIASHCRRLSAVDLQRFARVMEARLGSAFVRRAGLPVSGPSLRVA